MHALAEDVVDDAECVHHAGALLNDLQQPVVGDGDERVDLVHELGDALLRDEPPLGTLEAERLGNDSHRERADVLGDLGDDRCRPGPGTAAHTRGDEHHIGFLERLVELLAVILGGLAADRRIGTRAEALGDLVADAQLVGGIGEEKRLGVGVHRDELDPHQLGADHPIDGVRSAAADTDDLYEREVLYIASEGHGQASTSFHAAAPPLAVRSWSIQFAR